MENKIYGVIYGQALGDALGSYCEFKYKQTLAPYMSTFKFPDPKPEMIFFNQNKNDWTDDTDQLILLMDTLTQHNNIFDIDTFARKLQYWKNNGFPELGDKYGYGIGCLTTIILGDENYLTNPIKTSKKYATGSAPNGSMMRTAIMACRPGLTITEILTDSCMAGACTHADPRCVISEQIVTNIIYLLINNTINISDNSFLNELYKQYIMPLPAQYHESFNFYYDKDITAMDLSHHEGYAFVCLAVAIWAFRRRRENFKENILLLIAQGGDADTNAAVAGAIWGAHLGYDKLPTDWLEGLVNKKWLDEKIKNFIKIVM